MAKQRESLSSRLGFLFLAAGCAIGLGNIWRFPFITGQNGGGMFVLLYLLFLLILGFPILVMELSIGRASRQNLVGGYRKLSAGHGKFPWQRLGSLFFLGNLLLMMFYTTVSGWLLAYAWHYLTGDLAGYRGEGIQQFFDGLAGSSTDSILYMAIVVGLAVFICSIGLRNGVENSAKIMMSVLLLMLIVLAAKALMMPEAGRAVRFYLAPDFAKFSSVGIGEVVYAAMGQAFFTLSLGVGSMAIFGSYIEREHSLTKESLFIILLDTFVAILAGLIIFPICFSYGIDVGAGPRLVFVSLPNIFNDMAGGRWWGSLFFIFMTLAALTTVVAVFENLIAFLMDEGKMRRIAATLTVGIGVFFLSLPCVLGFNAWSGVQPFGPGSTILDLEDFIVSQNLLPLGSLYVLLFCVMRYGWGWKNFLAEADAGSGLKFPHRLKYYFFWVLPAIILMIFIVGYCKKFF
ncbi:sodium-dependent transporter [Victivallis sp. Marseille-Q1083]|uniref:sodium-dependent transporter n=1 Tax=Victivallis sp. Marseille-Q1083 TaxID=2717288 RepID=UPI00158993DC|nr:sodium-dependent transporter [Victivallis sp. Marseille-Q1083]